jgi:hypothetical protein
VGYLGNDQEVDRALYWTATKERRRERQIPGGEMINVRCCNSQSTGPRQMLRLKDCPRVCSSGVDKETVCFREVGCLWIAQKGRAGRNAAMARLRWGRRGKFAGPTQAQLLETMVRVVRKVR